MKNNTINNNQVNEYYDKLYNSLEDLVTNKIDNVSKQINIINDKVEHFRTSYEENEQIFRTSFEKKFDKLNEKKKVTFDEDNVLNINENELKNSEDKLDLE